jgi:hypothetical protein
MSEPTPLRPVDRPVPAPYRHQRAKDFFSLEWGARTWVWDGHDVHRALVREAANADCAIIELLGSHHLIEMCLPDDGDESVYDRAREFVVVEYHEPIPRDEP